MQTILVTGGTGLIGTALSHMLVGQGYAVIILTRNTSNKKPAPGITYAAWNVKAGTIDTAAVAAADHIVHLAGAGVADKRWTSQRKAEIKNSRVQSSSLIVKALREMPNKVQTVVSASAIGWYGGDERLPAGQTAFTEDMPPDNAFLGETCRLWEESIQPVKALGKRLVIIRTGIVLSNKGGALPQFKTPLKFGVAAVLGHGRQVISWIHIQDMCRLYLAALQNTQMEGPFNGVAPHPVSNRQLTLTLARLVNGRMFITLPVPSFVLTLALGQMSIEVLKSATVSSAKTQNSGFSFLYSNISEALKDLCAS